jgi:hypothetical protein
VGSIGKVMGVDAISRSLGSSAAKAAE